MADSGKLLRDYLQDALAVWCAENDNSLLTNFVFVAEFLEEDGGAPSNVVTGLDNASTSSLLGLSMYALNLYTELQRREVLESIYVDEDDGDDDE